MNDRTVHELGGLARVLTEGPDPARAVRRARLERFAALLDECKGRLRLLSRIEYTRKAVRESMRADDSPLALAYADPVFRAQGLASDRLGDIMRFFDLSWSETHHVFCDCHYGTMAVGAGAIARRVRALASKRSLAEIWQQVRDGFATLWQR